MMRVFEWIIKQGGLPEMEKRANTKSKLLYTAIEESNGYYQCPVEPKYHSRVNVPFILKAGPEFEAKFLKGAQQKGMIQLKGHRSVGGIRASLYNAITVEETQTFVDYLKEFQKNNDN